MLFVLLYVGLVAAVVAVLALVCLQFRRRGEKTCRRRLRGRVEATVGVGVTPAGVAVARANAYVANNNNYGIAGSDSVSVVRLRDKSHDKSHNNQLVTTIVDASFVEPYTVTVSPNGARVYVTNSGGATVTIIDTFTNAVVGTIDGFDGPSGLVIQPGTHGRWGYVNNYGGPGGVGSGNGTTVRRVDLHAGVIVGPPIVVGLAPAALCASPGGDSVYVANYVDGNPGTGTVSVISTTSNTVQGTITGLSGPFAIVAHPRGRWLYATNFGSNNFAPYGTTVAVIDLKAMAVVENISVGIQPAGLAITPDGRFLLVSLYNTLYAGPSFTNLTAGQGTVLVIDTRTRAVVGAPIAVAESPANIAIDQRGATACVTNYTSNVLSVLKLRR